MTKPVNVDPQTVPLPIKELTIEDLMEPSIHYTQGEGEGWESDTD